MCTAIAMQGGEPVASDMLAQSARTNPAVIRRLATQLAATGIMTSQRGQGGGLLLARHPREITLCDIYRAVEEDRLFALPRTEPNEKCVVGCHIRAVLCKRMSNAERALEEELASTTIADLTREIRRLEKQG